MANAALVVMAAGMGSRFSGGIKQLEPVGPSGEIMMDYSIHDAMEAGFDKVVFVIRKSLEKDFKEVVGNRIEQIVETKYAFQEIEDIPEEYQIKYAQRKKPWGTGQAILCCKDIIKEPFVVINADDYYGKEAYREAYKYLTTEWKESNPMEIAMVGFVLGNTLSENGGVTRGICHTDENQMLLDIEETRNVEKTADGAGVRTENGIVPVDASLPVSMNMWGMQPQFFKILEKGFAEFLEQIADDFEKAEYLLPTIVGELLIKGRLRVKVLRSHDQWFGVTYREDKEAVCKTIQELIAAGVYPEKLF